jgi:Protein of unknown function (DUF2911)
VKWNRAPRVPSPPQQTPRPIAAPEVTVTHAPRLAAVIALALASGALAADKPSSPRGSAAMQIGGKAEGAGWKGGSWVEVDYGRPLLRGRADIFGKGADYGKLVNGDAPVWRLGANEATHLKTEAALTIAGKKVAAGDYAAFVELKEGAWTLILSTQPTRGPQDPKGTPGKIWGSYGYDPKFDVVRAPMALSKSDVSVEQLTIGFADVTAEGGKLQIAWGNTVATLPIALAK